MRMHSWSTRKFARRAAALTFGLTAGIAGAQALGDFEPGKPSRIDVGRLRSGAAAQSPEALGWLEGNIAYTQHLNCFTGTIEFLTGHYVGYYGETNVTFPRVGDVYYGHVVVSTLGLPCAGPYVHLEAWPPPASDFVNSASYPIYCFYTSVSGQTSQITDGSCPVAANLTIGPYGGYNLDARPSASYAGGPWPLAQGAFLEIQFPMISFTPLSGIATNFGQGALDTTGSTTDLGISGRGFFIVEDATSSLRYATRDGHFRIDDNGYLVSQQGLRVQGLAGTSLGAVGDIQVGTNIPVGAELSSISFDTGMPVHRETTSAMSSSSTSSLMSRRPVALSVWVWASSSLSSRSSWACVPY